MDITSANAVILLTVPLYLPVPTQLQGFAADDIYDTDDVVVAETLMGVDGNLSGGTVFNATVQTFSLQADSPSVDFFDGLDAAQQASAKVGGPGVFPVFGNITLTSVGKSYTMSNGILTRAKRLPDAKKMLQPRKWQVMWQTVVAVPIGIAG